MIFKFMICLFNGNKLSTKITNIFYMTVKGRGNKIKIKSKFNWNKVTVLGDNNKIDISGESIYRTKIVLIGSGNKLIIEESRGIGNSTFVIKGNDCTISVGKSTAIGGARIVAGSCNNKISIGEKCMISDNVEIWCTDTHKIFDINHNQVNHDRDVTIGNKVWIGTGASILKGSDLADGSIVGMGSLVSSSCLSNSVYVGNPAKKVKCDVYWEI